MKRGVQRAVSAHPDSSVAATDRSKGVSVFRRRALLALAAATVAALALAGHASAADFAVHAPSRTHALGCPPACTVTPGPTLTLEVGAFKSMTPGSGTITSTDGEFHCTVTGGVISPNPCKHTYPSGTAPDVSVTLTPAPGSACGYVLAGVSAGPFTDPCDYNVHVDSDILMDVYVVLTRDTLTVTKSGEGTGTVASSPAGINCGAVCSVKLDYGTQVTLTATADAGAVFKTWTGACNGQGPTCTLTIAGDTSTNAVFGLPPSGGGGGSGGSGGAGTGGGGGTGSGGGGSGGTADTTLEAQLVAVKVGKSNLGIRLVRVEIAADEQISIDLTLVRNGKSLVRKHLVSYEKDDGIVSLAIPAAVKKGAATLEVTLTDLAGNGQTLTRSVRIPRSRA